MLRLFRQALLKGVSLRHCLADWFRISCQLREAPRERRTQQERLRGGGGMLS
jgi:hypothetical protein